MKLVADEAGRADKVLARKFPDAGRRQLARMFDDGAVRVKGKRASKGDRVEVGDEIELAYEPASGDALRPIADDTLAVAVLLERPDFVVVDKPAGMPSQPLRANERGTAANAIAARWPECSAIGDDPRDGGLVHRLDVGTSGALAAARTPEAFRSLRDAFSAGTVGKEYLAITCGRPVARDCDLPLAQRGDHVVHDEADGLPASTAFVVERSTDRYALVRCHARTGRMHQVRAHLALCGAPILGDVLYKGEALGRAEWPDLRTKDGFFLHAARLVLPGADVTAPLPARFTAALAELGL